MKCWIVMAHSTLVSNKKGSFMWTAIWIGTGVFFWVVGYFSAGVSDEQGAIIQRALLRPPIFIYQICGKPTPANLPKGVIALRAMMSQLLGILFITYGSIAGFFLTFRLSVHVVILVLAMVSVYLFSWWLYKHFRYMNNDS